MTFGTLASLAAEALESRRTGERFTESRTLTGPTGLGRFVVRHETLAPGRRSAAPHHHTRLEELHYVLSGSPTARVGDTERRLHPGDFVAFPAGDPAPHCLVNETDAPVTFLTVSAGADDDEVVYAQVKSL